MRPLFCNILTTTFVLVSLLFGVQSRLNAQFAVFDGAAFAPHAIAASSCQATVKVWQNGTVTENPKEPLVLLSTDHFDKETGAYISTTSEPLSAFVTVTSPTNQGACGITAASYEASAPLLIHGGAGSPSHPLRALNVAFSDTLSGRPFSSYPVNPVGTVTITVFDKSTQQTLPPISITVVLVVIQAWD
jgi:hypothetical protein